MPEPRIAIIDNAIYRDIYKPVAHWGAFLPGSAWTSFYAPAGKLPDPDDFSHFIFTGSEASILDREAWVAPEIELARTAYKHGKLLLGSCYGHQLLALALAGPDHIGRAPEPEIGWIAVDILEDSAVLGPPCRAIHVLIALRRSQEPAGGGVYRPGRIRKMLGPGFPDARWQGVGHPDASGNAGSCGPRVSRGMRQGFPLFPGTLRRGPRFPGPRFGPDPRYRGWFSQALRLAHRIVKVRSQGLLKLDLL